MGSESDCLLGKLNRILEISDSEAGLKVEKSGGVIGEVNMDEDAVSWLANYGKWHAYEKKKKIGEVGEYGDADVELLARERRSLDILSVKEEARLSARALAEVEVGRGEEDLRCKSFVYSLPETSGIIRIWRD